MPRTLLGSKDWREKPFPQGTVMILALICVSHRCWEVTSVCTWRSDYLVVACGQQQGTKTRPQAPCPQSNVFHSSTLFPMPGFQYVVCDFACHNSKKQARPVWLSPAATAVLMGVRRGRNTPSPFYQGQRWLPEVRGVLPGKDRPNNSTIY